MLQTVTNAGRVLELFTVAAPERGVTEVAQALGIPKSRAHALMSTLSEVGLLHRTAESRYRLGWQVLALSRVLSESTESQSGARSVMRELAARFAETVHLAALHGGRVIYVDKLEGTRAVRISVSSVGAQLPAHCSGVGKTLLAHRPWAEVRHYIETHGMERFTPNTIDEPQRLRAALKEIRDKGWGMDLEEAAPEVCCVAAPIFDHLGVCVQAISLSVPAHRFRPNHEHYRPAVLDAAARISRRLGYRTPARMQ